MQDHPISPAALVRSLWRNRNLITQMTRREVIGRYNGSILGVAWSFLHPLLMLTVYTFVFGVVFKARWGGAEESKLIFALVLFTGMIVHSLFAECVIQAPSLILNNPNYVKKVVFPLEILPFVALLTALFHTAVSAVVLVTAMFLSGHPLHWTIALSPLVVAPLALVTLGAAWLLASLGVYIRDVSQTMGIITTVMMFLSPMFYPVSALPETFQPLIMANPLTLIMEQLRAVLVWGQLPNWRALISYVALAALFAWASFAWFQKTRKGFADVL